MGPTELKTQHTRTVKIINIEKSVMAKIQAN